MLTKNENNAEFVKKVKEALNRGSNLYEDKQRIAEITFTSITPWKVGDAEGKRRDVPTPDTIVGKTRWFLRTVYNTFCASNLYSYEESFDFVNNFLGSNSKASLFTVEVSQTEKKSPMKNDRKVKSPISIEDNFIVKIYQTFAYPEKDEVAKFKDIFIGGLLITLAYIGIGKGANRGYGRFYPVEIVYNESSEESSVKEIAKKIQSGYIREAFETYYDLFVDNNPKDKCSKDKRNDWRKSSVPLAPRLEDEYGIGLKVVKVDDRIVKSPVNFIKCIVNKKKTLNNLPRNNLLSTEEIACLRGKNEEEKAENEESAEKRRKRGRISFLDITPVYKIINNREQLCCIAFIPFLSLVDYNKKCSEKDFEKIFNTLTNDALKHCLSGFKGRTEGYDRKPYRENRGWKGRERKW